LTNDNYRYYSQKWLEEGVGRVPPHKDKEVSKMRMTCFKRFFPNPEDLAKVKEEYARFSSCSEEFNDPDSIQDRWSLSPMTWWTNHGQYANLSVDEPELQAVTFGLDAQEVDVADDNEPDEE